MEKATRQQLKDHNIQLILRTIFTRRATSRADISRHTGLTKTTVSEIVAELLSSGLVEEIGVGSSAGGKPPMLLNPRPDARQVVCLDLESTEFRGAVANLQGQLRNRTNIPTQGLKGDEALKRVFVLIDSLIAATESPLLGIGIGTPGLVDARGERIVQAVNLGWRDLPLGLLLQERYQCPVYLSNDSQAAALAEFSYGNRPASGNMVLIKSGQGIGAGIILNGQIFRGDGSSTGEIGHLRVVDENVPCTCGNQGCLEAVASNRALIARALQSGSLNLELAGRPEDEVFLRLVEGFRQGDPAIQHLAYEAGQYFGIAVSSLVAILNIHHIVISGAITAFGDILLNAIQAQVVARVLEIVAKNVWISFSTQGKDGVMLGAGALTVSNELSII